jgi:hypothetical protein
MPINCRVSASLCHGYRRQTLKLDVGHGNCRSADHGNTVGSSCIVRIQAAFHSALLMCVSESQNPMQSARDSPPPPGALGAESLGLAENEAPGDSAMFGCTTPPLENCVES